MFTSITGCSTSGIWFTRRFFSASSPRHMSAMMMTTVDTGRLMLKSERNMALASVLGGGRGALGLRRGAGRGRLGRGLDRLPVLQQRGRVADHAVAFGEAALQQDLAGARVAIAHAHL